MSDEKDKEERAKLQKVSEMPVERVLIAHRTVTIEANWLMELPARKPVVLNKWPIGCTSALVAGGGVGKTQYIVRDAMKFAVEGGHTLIVSAEDEPDDYAAKIHNQIYSPMEKGRGDMITTIDKVTGQIHVTNMRGFGRRLVTVDGGIYKPSKFAQDIGLLLCEDMPYIKLVVFETLSRFSGGETNEHFEAAVTACDHIARKANVAVVLVHHIGKAASRDKIVDLYTGRGGSTLGDNTRSMVVLTPLSLKQGKNPGYLGEIACEATNDEIKAGIVFEAKHVRFSYGPTIKPEYFRKVQGYANAPVLESINVVSSEDALKRSISEARHQRNAASEILYKVIKNEGGEVPAAFFDVAENRSAFGLSRDNTRLLIEEMIDAGSINKISRQEQTGRGQQTRTYLTTLKGFAKC